MLFGIAGPQQGSVFPIHAANLKIGRDSCSDIPLRDESASSTHALVSLRPDGTYLEDLGSRNGTFVNDERLERRTRLADGDYVRIGDSILKFSMVDDLEERALTMLFELTVRDPLTRAYNRRYLMEHLGSELASAARQQTPLSILLLDIDHFKRVNDTFGHAVGDLVLKLVAANVQRVLRPYDALCRVGGEEFVIVTRDTSLRNAQILAERIRRRIQTMPLDVAGVSASITVSIGVISIVPQVSGEDPDGLACSARYAETLLESADEALYRAKSAGRNRVVCGSAPAIRTERSSAASVKTRQATRTTNGARARESRPWARSNSP